jgi:MoaA/NifB/PqqE/SkfB family radical SAM enzyme
MVTRRCTMTCRHCSVESSPKVADRQPSQEELLAIVRDAAEAGVTSIQFTGGEPMMRPKLVLKLMREAQRLGVKSALSTNGFWGRTPASALRTLRALVKAGLCRLTVSHDRYHAEHQGPTPAVNIVRAAERLYFPVNINVTRLAGEEGLEQVVEPFVGLPAAQLRFYDVQPVGAAVRTVADDDWRGETAGFCNACDSPAISDDGRLMACNGPSYFAPPGHPLHLGSLREKPLAEPLTAMTRCSTPSAPSARSGFGRNCGACPDSKTSRSVSGTAACANSACMSRAGRRRSLPCGPGSPTPASRPSDSPWRRSSSTNGGRAVSAGRP